MKNKLIYLFTTLLMSFAVMLGAQEASASITVGYGTKIIYEVKNGGAVEMSLDDGANYVAADTELNVVLDSNGKASLTVSWYSAVGSTYPKVLVVGLDGVDGASDLALSLVDSDPTHFVEVDNYNAPGKSKIFKALTDNGLPITDQFYREYKVSGAPNSTVSFTATFHPSAARGYANVLHPVPEPATMILLGTGLAGVVSASRRRRVKAQKA